MSARAALHPQPAMTASPSWASPAYRHACIVTGGLVHHLAPIWTKNLDLNQLARNREDVDAQWMCTAFLARLPLAWCRWVGGGRSYRRHVSSSCSWARFSIRSGLQDVDMAQAPGAPSVFTGHGSAGLKHKNMSLFERLNAEKGLQLPVFGTPVLSEPFQQLCIPPALAFYSLIFCIVVLEVHICTCQCVKPLSSAPSSSFSHAFMHLFLVQVAPQLPWAILRWDGWPVPSAPCAPHVAVLHAAASLLC